MVLQMVRVWYLQDARCKTRNKTVLQMVQDGEMLETLRHPQKLLMNQEGWVKPEDFQDSKMQSTCYGVKSTRKFFSDFAGCQVIEFLVETETSAFLGSGAGVVVQVSAATCNGATIGLCYVAASAWKLKHT